MKRVPSFFIPHPDRPSGGWLALAVAIHALLIIGIVMAGRAAALAAGGGGGGRGGGGVIHYIELPPALSAATGVLPEDPRTEQLAAELALTKPELEVPVPKALEVDLPLKPRTIVSIETSAEEAGTGSDLGLGSGSGGGSGTGKGTGVGSNLGPGVGEHRYVLAPEPRSVLYPFEEAPRSIRGRQFTVRFWVDARGRVNKVEVQPPIEDASFLKKLLQRMYGWIFYPARMADGTAVEGELVITYRP